MKLVYISGKYTRTDKRTVRDNIKLAERYGIKIWNKGYAVLIPHMNTAFLERKSKVGYNQIMEADLLMLSRCDILFLLPNYKSSRGALQELELAKKLEIPIYTKLKDL